VGVGVRVWGRVRGRVRVRVGVRIRVRVGARVRVRVRVRVSCPPRPEARPSKAPPTPTPTPNLRELGEEAVDLIEVRHAALAQLMVLLERRPPPLATRLVCGEHVLRQVDLLACLG
jgi:hypothetical protein